MHDMLIEGQERQNAVKDFMFNTDFKGNTGTTDSVTAKALQEFAD